MAATPTTVARWMPVSIAVPLAAIGAREEVPPQWVTDLGAYACRHVATRANLWVPFLANAFDSEKAQQWHALVTWWRVRLASVRWRQESHWRVRVHQSRDVQDVTF